MLSELHMDLIAFFNKNKGELLHEWENSIVISNGDPYKEKISLNGIAIFNIVLNMHTMTEEELLETIQKYALEISEERALANINIGDFV
ncbi:histidine kinase N-terminal domain-containing protein, partial [Neobacillus niacini]|uniref:histidine kinase N-terminal domain-containing protein n=1 Tax=Neobacillus niacini TaxID=86668 RepID=UPI0030001955